MKTPTAALDVTLLRKALPVALALGLALVSAHAYAGDYEQITISAPRVKVVGRDPATLAPIEENVVTAHVSYDPVTLTLNSGVALLKDSVLDAARKVCAEADPTDVEDDATCIEEAMRAAQPQIDAAVARARSQAANH